MKKIIVLLLITLAVSACQRPARLEQTVIPNSSTPIAGESVSPGNYTLSMGPQGDEREVILHLPPAYDGSSQLPLVIVLHGGGQNAAGIQRLTEMDEDADQFSFAVAYPNGRGRLDDRVLTWNSGHCCESALEQQVDDVAFLDSLIGILPAQYAIDENMIYVTGISNGGMLAYRTGAELADKVAAIAPIAATIGGQASEASQEFVIPTSSAPVAVIAFHGMQDHNVPYEGGMGTAALSKGRIDLPVATSIQFWAEANGCGPIPVSETLADGKYRHRYLFKLCRWS
ncbi:MAG: lipoprotein [Chloroflexi bacterium]|nr:lipoprotein [Chloroflexota bacterium]